MAVVESGESQQFTATMLLADGSMKDLTSSVAWASSDSAIARLDSNATPGLAIAGITGTATITAMDLSSGFTAQASFTVSAASLDRIEIMPAGATIPLGSSGRFTAEGIYTDESRHDLTSMLQWSSSSTNTAEVSNQPGSHGAITTHAIGPTSITATHLSSGISATVTLIVTNPIITTIKITPAQASIGIGRNQRFQAIAIYSDTSEINISRQVDWRTSSATIASVSNQASNAGMANGLSAGTATISAFHMASGVSSDDNGNSAILLVLPAVLTSIAVTPLQADIPRGATQAFTATGIYSSGPSRNITAQVNWQSSSPSIAMVSNSTAAAGVAQSLAEGQTNIIATDPMTGISSDDSSRSAVLTVRPPELVRIEITPATANMVVMGQQQFTATAYYSDGTQNDITRSRLTTWNTTSSNIVSVNSFGLAAANSMGSAVISARDTNSNISSNDSNSSATINVMVATLTSIDITPTSTVVPAGVSTQFTAVGSYNNGASANISAAVTWSSSDNAVASVSNTQGSRGQVTSVSAGGAIISATESTSGISSDTSGQSASITVNNVVINALTISPTMPSNLGVGNTLQFSSMGNFTDGSMHDVTSLVTWNSSNNTVATVGTAGLVSAAAIGTTNISASAPSPSMATSNVVALTVNSSNLFSDDFEDGDFSDWSGTNTGFSINSSLGANQSSKSLRVDTTGRTGHYNGVFRALPSIQPTEIGMYVRTDRVGANGYVVIGNDSVGSGSNHGMIFFHFASGSVMYVYAANRRYGETSFVANRWYLLEFKNINWTAKTFEFHVDGRSVANSVPFRQNNTASITKLHFYNFQTAVAHWDEIIMR